MAKDWIKRRNIDLENQARAMSRTLAEDPGAYGIDPADAAALVGEFQEFSLRYRTTMLPSTRTPIAIMNRNEARAILTRRMRSIAWKIRGNPAVTNEMRINLGVPVDGAAEPEPQSPPRTKPWIEVLSLLNHRLTLRLKDSELSTRGVPRHYSGAQIFMFAGERSAPPVDICQWRLAGITTKAKTTITLPELPPGSPVTLAARWFNTHGPGPTSAVAETWVGRMFVLPILQAA